MIPERYQHRWLDRAVAGYLVFSALAIAALIVVVITLALHNQSSITAQKAAAAQACRSGNATRHETGRILGEIIGLPAVSRPQFQTAAEAKIQAAQVARLARDVTVNYGKTNTCGGS